MQIELIPGTNRDLSLSQWFTPPELAARVVEWADIRTLEWSNGKACRVLEPSAGNGALVRPLAAAGAEVHALELDPRYRDELWDALRTSSDPLSRMHCPVDFLQHGPLHRFDLCVMNPPYENGLDVKFILHALNFAPRVVGIFQAGIEYGVDRYDDLWSVVRTTRILKLKRRWFKGADGKGGLTNYVVLELVKRSRCDADDMCRPDNVTLEWW